ncbi:MAG: phosphoenolpyruvate synthase [Syntrophorhabdus sp. PtaB.Bin047]|nr:MAG: phosphoenolpyruvate synthase [Syntrophorhabdus sp. PtaB.Bin047]
MARILSRESAGIAGIDEIIDGLRTGDNVVWQVDSIDDYLSFARPFAEQSVRDGKKVVYMRFARHRPVIEDNESVRVHNLDARSGFESFTAQVYNIITSEGRDVHYVFDSLSDLLSAWATDLMIGNFFTIACPYLYQLNTIAYFALLRENHSFKTVARIRETTQVLIDVYNVDDKIYVHPLKVRGRHSPTMFLPHRKSEDRFLPVTSSVDTGRLLTRISGKGTDLAKRNLDHWDRFFIRIGDLLNGKVGTEEQEAVLDQLCRIMIGREERIVALAKKHFTLEDLLAIKARLIGTGYIGGKTVGMLLARKILSRDRSFDWQRILEPHDSFFIGSDVFYTYLVENGWWKLRMEQKTRDGYFKVAKTLREAMLEGSFPDEIEEQFWRLIEYFGQSPIIIRSSSLLEDAFGNAFAGKYESVFCVNQGTPEERYKQFGEYVRTVYASTMNEDALAYRLQRGLDKQDEQMALLVQRVSGSYHDRYFYPDLAGVGISYNTFVWRRDMNPKAGMLRLVVGLGTRAVNRVEHDYPGIVALDLPLLRPHSGPSDMKKYSQHNGDVLNVETNVLETIPVTDIITGDMKADRELIGTRDLEAAEFLRSRGLEARESWIVTFDRLMSETPLPTIMQRMLKTLEASYQYPVDIEFTINFTARDAFQINLVQCRPLQTKGEGKRVRIPRKVPADRILFQSSGNFMGSNITQGIKRIIVVDPDGYSLLTLSEKYDIARLIGRINRQIPDQEEMPTILAGPGRWGTTTPSLGVPVRFSEINNIAVLVELAHGTGLGSVMPELSFGTHFFQDLVETGVFYVAIFPDREGSYFSRRIVDKKYNLLSILVPESARYEGIVTVVDTAEDDMKLLADVVTQKVICFSALKTDQ